MHEIWERLKAEVAKLAPHLLSRLHSGVDEEALREAELLLGMPLPEEIKLLFGEQNGRRTFFLTREWKMFFIRLPLFVSPLPLTVILVFVLGLWEKFGPLLALSGGIGLYVLYYFLFSLFVYFITKPTKHIVTTEGITFCTLVYCIFTPWDNIKGVGRSRLGIYQPPALLLKEAAIRGKIRQSSLPERATIERRQWLTSKKYASADAIPLLFTVPNDWQESELGLLIQYYAPQAFSDDSK